MNICKKLNNLIFEYSLIDIILTRTNMVKVLDILFDTKLSFSSHIISIKNIALSYA
jgi:hypothetical protein